MDKGFQFMAEGPGIPATGTIQVSKWGLVGVSTNIVGNEGTALSLAQWLYNHATAASCKALRDALTRLIGGE